MSFIKKYVCLLTLLTTWYNTCSIVKKRSEFSKFPYINDQNCVECGTRTIQHQPIILGPDRPTSKIIGGISAPYGAYPWQVEIQAMQNVHSWEHHCGGAIIAENIVLTAAHCLQQFSKNDLRILVGKHKLKHQDTFQHIYQIERILVHPHFRKEGPHSNDIALLKIKNTTGTINGIMCNSHVQTICLPEGHIRSKDVGDWCTVSGWGTQTHGSSKISGVLQAALVPLLDLATCRQMNVYGSAGYQTILDSMICAGTLEGGVDACGGDSGGPLACKINGRFVLLGVVSWGDGCARKNRPGVYTRVSYFLPWIEKSISTFL
ncbi:hypothetical protein PGB90_000029 [Kerria lacca]